MTTHDPKLVQELAEEFALRLTLPQLKAIAKDTRLPGEIAGAYGVTAAVVIRIQHLARVKEAAARRRMAPRDGGRETGEP